MKKYLLLIIVILLLASPCFGANYCVTPTGAGTYSGADWDNAMKWNSGANQLTFVRDNYYYLADGTYEARTLSTAESGSTYIYIYKATHTGEHVSDTGWVSTMGDGEAVITDNSSGVILDFTTGYWHFSGVSRTDWTSGYGIRVTTTATYATDPSIILCDLDTGTTSDDYYVFEYIEFDHREDRANPCSDDCIYANATGGDAQGVQYCTIKYCYIHGASRVLLLTRNVKYWTFEYNYVADNYSSPQVHGATWSAGGCDNVIVRYNKFVDVCGTAVMDLKGNEPEWEFNNWEFYGNLIYHTDGYDVGNLANGLFHQTSPHGGTAESGTSTSLTDTNHAKTVATDALVGLTLTLYSGTGSGQTGTITANTSTDGGADTSITITCSGATFSPTPSSDTVFYYSKGVHNAQIYNNTAYNITYYSGTGATNAGIMSISDHDHTGNVAYNNLWYNCSVSTASLWKSVDTHDHNWYYLTRQYNAGPTDWNHTTLAALDTDGEVGTGDPFTDSANYDLTLSAANNNGQDDLGSPYNLDLLGNARGADGVWDRGAYEYVAYTGPYYVSTSGDDANNGTSTSTSWRYHPWMHGASGVADATILTDGDIVYFKRGDTFTGEDARINEWDNGTSDYITMKTHPTWGIGDNALLCPTRSWTTGWTNHSGNVWKRTAASAEIPISWIWFTAVDDAHAGIMERDKTDLDTEYEFTYNTDDAPTSDTDILYVYSTTDPNTITIYYSGHANYSPVKIYGTGVKEFKYHKWENLRFWGGKRAIYYTPYVGGTNTKVIIDGCTFKYNSVCWDASGTTPAILFGRVDAAYSTDIEITDNTFDTCAEGAIKVSGGTNITIARNTMTDMKRGFLAVDSSCWNAGIKLFRTSDAVVENNIVTYDSGGDRNTIRGNGIWLDTNPPTGTEGENQIVRYNYVSGWKRGIFDENCDETDIYYNILVNNQYGIQIGYPAGPTETEDIRAYNNTVYNADYGIYIANQKAGTTVTAKNNIFADCDTYYAYVHADTSGTVTSDYNAYEVAPDAADKFHWQGADMTFNTWDDSRDANAQCNADLGVDDLDFDLEIGSLCIDAGTDVSLTQDYNGRIVPNNIVDIGALEYYSDAPPPPSGGNEMRGLTTVKGITWQ